MSIEDQFEFQKKPHGIAIECLRDKAFEIGGKLFTEAAIRHSAEMRAKNGDKTREDELKIADFAKSLLSGMSYGYVDVCYDEQRFNSLLNSIVTLINIQEQQEETHDS